jgi:hypothetical protein
VKAARRDESQAGVLGDRAQDRREPRAHLLRPDRFLRIAAARSLQQPIAQAFIGGEQPLIEICELGLELRLADPGSLADRSKLDGLVSFLVQREQQRLMERFASPVI